MSGIVSLSAMMRPENLKIQHTYKVGQHVKVTIDYEFVKDAGGNEVLIEPYTIEAIVVGLVRDCDGEPLYELSTKPVARSTDIAFSQDYMLWAYLFRDQFYGPFCEESLTPVDRFTKVLTFREELDTLKP